MRIDGRELTGPTAFLEAGAHQVVFDADLGTVRIQRYGEGFIETRQPLDGYKALFPKEQYLLAQ